MTDDPGTDRRPTGRILLSSTAAPLAVAAAGALVLRSWHAQLPDPIATHWNLDGTADGFAGLPATIALLLGFGVLFAALGFGLARAADTDPALTRAVAATVTGTVAFVTALIVLVTGSQRGLADAAAASPPGASLLAALGIGVALGAVAAAAVPRWSRGPAAPPAADAPRIPLGADELVAWTRSVATGNVTTIVLVAAIGIVAALSVLTRLWILLGLAVLLAVLVALTCSIRVTVDVRGVTVAGLFGWPHLHTPLGAIASASVTDVAPLKHFGGYGYRMAVLGPLRGARGFVLRGGPALVLHRRDGARTLVVVDDAATAAGLVNALVETGPRHPQ